MLDEALYPGMAAASVVVQLDVLYVGLTALTLLHAVSKRGLISGAALVAYLAAHTALFEHVSLFLGGTHCHATSSLLPMVTPCSSINSVLFYVPWGYTSIEAARRLDLHWAAFPFAVGLLQIGFGAVYEMQGPWNGFWRWPDGDGVIASSSALKAWDGYPPILHEAKQQKEVATIVDGIFRVSHHAADALTDRLYGFPLLAPHFHFAFGFGWASGLLITGRVSSASPPSLIRFCVAGLAVFVLFLPPIWITRGLGDAASLPLSRSVPISLAVSAIPPLISCREISGLRTSSSASSPFGPDRLLFTISLIMHAFMLSFPWRAPTPPPPGLFSLVALTAAMHLAAQYVCCFVAGTGRRDAIKKEA